MSADVGQGRGPDCGSGPDPPDTIDDPRRGRGAARAGAGEEAARFLPGTVIAGRYRIVSLIGRGGMGEVYRADDLRLGRAVALKFLPSGARTEPGRLRALSDEVRLALRITHPNVCRVHDLCEADGQPFLSMEFVDGEDLASLLRRIGRLPPDRAVRIAHQICAGLAAAHAAGILHRDLKPANVMVDGRGSARITDFGLATPSAGVERSDDSRGTPAYMAPEQIAGRTATVRSDVYALGLVLYELFTGRRAFPGISPDGGGAPGVTGIPIAPSRLVEGLDPAVERTILRCMEQDPMERPGSALAVSAGLPGGDPLAAAIAAGETPSPELVATEAAEHSGIALPLAASALTAVLAGLALIPVLAAGTRLTRVTPLPRPAAVLRDEAIETLRLAGAGGGAADSASGFEVDGRAREALDASARSERPEALVAGGWPLLTYWYRQEPSPLTPLRRSRVLPAPGDPPPRAGTALVRLDTRGRLLALRTPPPSASGRSPRATVDWSPFLEAAGLDGESLHPVPPGSPAHAAGGVPAAWEAPHPDLGGRVVRVEAESVDGRPVAFRVVWPWVGGAGGEAAREPPTSGWARAQTAIEISWYLAALVLGLLLARHNLRLGHGHRQGAWRLAIVVLVSRIGSWAFLAHHVPAGEEMDLFVANLAEAVYAAALLWVLYIAVEPIFRRQWPRQMGSWVRILDGRFRDPRVGRDLLAGAFLGVLMVMNTDLYHQVPIWFGRHSPAIGGFRQMGAEAAVLKGGRYLVGVLGDRFLLSLRNAFMGLTLLVVLRLVLRRPWMAVTAWVLLAAALFDPLSGTPAWDAAVSVLQVGLFAVALLRFGFLSAAVATFLLYLLISYPMTWSLGTWPAEGTVFALTVAGAVAAYGFLASLGARRLPSIPASG